MLLNDGQTRGVGDKHITLSTQVESWQLKYAEELFSGLDAFILEV